MIEAKKEKENLKEENPGFVLRSATDTKAKPRVQQKKLRCHYCRTKDTCVSYLVCANYPNCRRGFCFTCLNTYFASSVDSNPSKFRSQSWVCVVCRGECDCQRCLEPKEEKNITENKDNPHASNEKGVGVLIVKEWRKKAYLEDEITFKGPKNYVQSEDEDDKKEQQVIKPKKQSLIVKSSSESSDYLPNVRSRKKNKRKLSMKRRSLLNREGKESESYKNSLDSKSFHSKRDRTPKLYPNSGAKKGITISASQSGGGKVVLKGVNLPPPGIPTMTQYIPLASRASNLFPAIPMQSPGKVPTFPDSAQISYTSLFHPAAGTGNPNQLPSGEHSIGQYSLNYSPAIKAADASNQQVRPGSYAMPYTMPNSDPQGYIYWNPSNPYSQGPYVPLDQNPMMMPGMGYGSYMDPSYYSQEAYASAYAVPSMPQNISYGGMQQQEKATTQKQKNSSKGKNEDAPGKNK